MFQNATVALSVSILAAIGLPLALILALMVCLSCLDKLRKRPADGFSNFSNSAEATNTSSAHVNDSFSMEMADNVESRNSTAIDLEPLPDLNAKVKLPVCPLRPGIGGVEKAAASDLKLILSHQPFPRSQIVYLKELGSGWFGKVIESDAEKISSGAARSKVVVKMLKDDASKDELQLFLEEVSPFRNVDHPNIMRLLGQCSEINPMLMILEYAAFGNLKHYLRNHHHEQKSRLIQFALDASRGLECLHAHDYVHRDLAARNCLVMTDRTLKVGDYGIAEDLYKEDYLTAGNDLLPIRWMAPETLKQEDGAWTAAGFSKESDVWSLGVVLWEIAMLGERPYDMLTDEAVLQGVMVDRDIYLPQPDIAMPAKDRLYEVMRFCWMEPACRLKVDEVYKLLEQIAQIASQTPQDEGPPGDAMTAFDQKWKHLVPNQRHESMDSADQQGSESSDDSIVLNYSDSNSLEDMTSAGDQPSQPMAPPRANRRKLSVRRVTIPGSEDASEEVEATAGKAQAKKQATAVPRINIVDETGQKVKQPGESGKPESTEFTAFTSHSTDDDEGSEDTPNVSQIVSEKAARDKDTFQADASSKAKETLENETSFTPDKSQAQSKTRETSTPMTKGETSPTSSSSLSGGDSSATFVTAHSSSPGNITEAYATASDNALVTDKTKSDFGMSSDLSASGDITMNFEILDTTAVPSVFDDFSKPEEESNATKVSDPFSTAASFNNDPFTKDVSSIVKDDGFGEFINGSLGEENSSTTPKDFVVASAGGDSPEAASKPANNEASSDFEMASAEKSDPFLSFGTDLSSLSSINVAKAAESTDQEQVFPSFRSEFSSLSSLKTDSTVTPQGEPQSDIFAFDQPAEPQESESSRANVTEKEPQKTVSGLEDFSFDLISSIPDVAADSTPPVDRAAKEGKQWAMDSADLSTIPLESGLATNPFVSEGGGQQQPVPDLFDFGDLSPPGLQDSSFEVLQHSQDSTRASMSSSAFSDFDILGSFSAEPAASSAAPSNPFGGGDLLQEFAGSSSSAAPVETEKESQDEVLLANTSADQSKSPDSALLDFSALESSGSADSKQGEEKAESTTTSGADTTTSSLIDF